MWAFRYAPDWLEAVSDLVDHPVVRSMEALPQHAKGFSCFHHSAKNRKQGS